MKVKEIPIKNAQALPHSAYFITDEKSSLLHMYLPVSHLPDKGVKWIYYNVSYEMFVPRYCTQQEVTKALREGTDDTIRIYQVDKYADVFTFCHFKLVNKSEINSLLKKSQKLNKKPAPSRPIKK